MNLTTVSGMLTFAATTGIISAILTQALGVGRDWIAARTTRRALAGYHALRLAVILESYAYACVSFITDNYNAPEPPDHPYPAWNTTLPELPPYPDEPGGWHSIDLRLAARALDLRNRIAGRQGIINSIAEYSECDLDFALHEHAASLGQEAWILAKNLRNTHDIPEFRPPWDFTEALEAARRSAEHAKAEREKSTAAMIAAVNSALTPTSID
jgi:hypothetical protein